MSDLLRTVAENGDRLLCGVTVLLACGSLALYLVRKPLYRQRLGEMLVAGTLLWLAVALVPMRRVTFDWPVDLRQQLNDVRQSQFLLAGDPEQAAESRSTVHALLEVPAARALWTNNSADVQFPTSAKSPTDFVERTSSRPILPIRAIFSRIYRLGALVTSFWLLIGRLSLCFAARRAKRPSAWLVELYASLDRKRDAGILITKRGQPMSFGVLSPKIMLPAAICRFEHSADLRHVLRHEQVHVDRRDACGHLVLNLALPFLYFHPCYWWIRSQITFSRELIADDQSCEPRTKAAYADSLVRVLQESTGPGVLYPAGTLGVFRSPFSRRMKMLIDRSQRLTSHTTKRWMVCALLSMVLGVAVVASVFGVEKPVQPKKVDAEAIRSTDSQSELGSVALDDPDTQPKADLPSARIPGITVPAADAPPKPTAPRQPDPKPSLMPPASPGTARSSIDCEISARATNMAFSTSGIVESVDIHEGDEVAQGQLIARLDDEEASHRVNLAVNNYEVAKSRAESKIQTDLAKNMLELAELNYQQAIDANQKNGGVVAAPEIRKLRSEIDKAAIELAQAREQAALSAKEALAKYELVKIAKKMLSARRLVARSPGIVTKIQRNPGSFANEGDTICTMVHMRTLYVEGKIPNAFLSPQGSIQPNLVVTIYPAHQGEGVVTKGQIISTSHTHSALYFRASIKNSRQNGAWLFSPGMKAVVRFTEFPPVPPSPGEKVTKIPASINSGLLWGGLPSSASSQAEVVAAMKEMVEFAEENLVRVQTRALGGIEGGEAVNVAAARYFLHHAKGQLAIARQDSHAAREQMDSAVAATADWFSAAKAGYEMGSMDISELQRAAAARASAKYRLAALNDLVGE